MSESIASPHNNERIAWKQLEHARCNFAHAAWNHTDIKLRSRSHMLADIIDQLQRVQTQGNTQAPKLRAAIELFLETHVLTGE